MVKFDVFKDYSIVCGVSNRHIGHEDFLRELMIERAPLARLEQVHKGKVISISGKSALSRQLNGYDAAVTNIKGVTLSVRTADCLPIFLYDPVKEAVGIAHAGWRGTKEGVVKNAVEAMKKDFKCEPPDIIIVFGPAIRQCCYEVNSEFLVHFPDSVVKMAHKHYFDLVGENAEQSISCGISSKNVFDCGICTSCRNDEFYSYRREKGGAGRILSVIMIRENDAK